MSFTKLLHFVVILSVIAAIMGGLYGYLVIVQGWFIPWQPLDQTPVKAVKISAHNEKLPFIETKNGETYLCSYMSTQYNDQEGCWIKTDRSQIEVIDSRPCYEVERFDIPDPPGKVVDMVEFESCEGPIFSVIVQHNFALLEDGSVWYWKHIHIGPVFVVVGIIYEMGVGAFWGAIIGTGIAVCIAVVVMIIKYFKGSKHGTA